MEVGGVQNKDNEVAQGSLMVTSVFILYYLDCDDGLMDVYFVA